MVDFTSIKNARDEYHRLDSKYNQALSKYALILLGAELSIAVLIVQNEVVRKVFVIEGMKLLYCGALLLCLISVILRMISLKFEALYSKNDMHVGMANLPDGTNISLLGIQVPLTHPNGESKRLAKKAIKYSDRSNFALILSTEFLIYSLVYISIFTVFLIYTI